MYLRAMACPSTMVWRRPRLRLPVLWLFRWRLPAWARLILPPADTRKRFLDALWVFIFGMTAPQPAPGGPLLGDGNDNRPRQGQTGAGEDRAVIVGESSELTR